MQNNMDLGQFLSCVDECGQVWHAYNRSFTLRRDYNYDYGFRVFEEDDPSGDSQRYLGSIWRAEKVMDLGRGRFSVSLVWSVISPRMEKPLEMPNVQSAFERLANPPVAAPSREDTIRILDNLTWPPPNFDWNAGDAGFDDDDDFLAGLERG